MHQGTRTRPATPADFHRLAAVAHERGLQLFREGPRWFCSSASDRGGCHYVTGFSCDCPGFVAHQRCSHHALLLERLGWLPEVAANIAAPEPPAPPDRDPTPEELAARDVVDCPGCSGCGVIVYHTFEERCPACGGSGIKPDHRLAGAPAIQPIAA